MPVLWLRSLPKEWQTGEPLGGMRASEPREVEVSRTRVVVSGMGEVSIG